MYNSNMKFMEKACKIVTEWISQWDIKNSFLFNILNPENSDETAMVLQGSELGGLLWSST